jgi:predicted nucleic acid-binding protein
MVLENVALAVPGIVWQEMLAAVKDAGQFDQLKNHLAAFPILLADANLHIAAAKIAHTCRAKRVSCSAVAALVAAHAVESNAQLFTLNLDFAPVARQAGFELFNYRVV